MARARNTPKHGRLLPPTAYQGAKQRLAPDIVDLIDPRADEPFADLCCGSGAVTLEAIAYGVPPELCTMVDAGPWGLFWQSIAEGTFDLAKLKDVLAEVRPEDDGGPARLKELAKTASTDSPEVFVVLQACAFGGKAVTVREGSFAHAGFRTRWVPKGNRKPYPACCPLPAELERRVVALGDALSGKVAVAKTWHVPGFRARWVPPVGGSNWRHPVSSPAEGEVVGRVERHAHTLGGRLRAIHGDAAAYRPEGGVVYVDPPYLGTTGYGSTAFDAEVYARRCGVTCYVSEARPMPGASAVYSLERGRRAGGLSGGHAQPLSEYLSRYDPQA